MKRRALTATATERRNDKSPTPQYVWLLHRTQRGPSRPERDFSLPKSRRRKKLRQGSSRAGSICILPLEARKDARSSSIGHRAPCGATSAFNIFWLTPSINSLRRVNRSSPFSAKTSRISIVHLSATWPIRSFTRASIRESRLSGGVWAA
jgi:hypothetical protein